MLTTHFWCHRRRYNHNTSDCIYYSNFSQLFPLPTSAFFTNFLILSSSHFFVSNTSQWSTSQLLNHKIELIALIQNYKLSTHSPIGLSSIISRGLLVSLLSTLGISCLTGRLQVSIVFSLCQWSNRLQILAIDLSKLKSRSCISWTKMKLSKQQVAFLYCGSALAIWPRLGQDRSKIRLAVHSYGKYVPF